MPSTDVAQVELDRIPWRERAFLNLPSCAEILGVSVASIYNLEQDGKLIFRRVAGRTLVSVPSLIELIDNAEHWTPQFRTAKATAARVKTVADGEATS